MLGDFHSRNVLCVEHLVMASSHGLSSLALQALEWGQGSVPGDSAPAQRAKAGHGCHQSSQGDGDPSTEGVGPGCP